ncbi:MAG TPA: hypothetical protein VFQ32_09140 [Ktedonobacterales bacterium]|nr:hypothetical protein [Ktedonobacterales bacterium]
MAAQTSIQQHPTPKIQEDDSAAPIKPQTATQMTTQTTGETLVQRDKHVLVHDARIFEERGRKLPVPSAQDFTQSTAILMGAAILVASALFAVGFMRPQLERALQRLLEGVEHTDVPLMLPVYIVDGVRELLAERRMVAK